MSNSNPSAPLPRWLVRSGLIALACYAVFIGWYFSIAAGGADSSGYFNSAKLFAAGHLETELRVPAEFPAELVKNRFQFLPLGFWPFPDRATITPTYPTGLPLHLALAGTLLGWTVGPVLVGLFTAVGAVWLCYAAAREFGLDGRLSVTAAAVLGLSPMFLFAAVQPLSDALATTWVLAAVYAALRARRSDRWALACGCALAIAVLVRPTNLVLAPTLVLLLGFNWPRLGLFVLGGVPGAIWQAVYNHVLYGGALHSGYGSIFETFHLYYGLPTAWHFIKYLSVLLPAVFLLLPFAALSRPELRTRGLLALAVWFFSIVGLYDFYQVSHEVWWCLRFILPAFPALIIGGMLGLESLASSLSSLRAGHLRTVASVALIAWSVGLAIWWRSVLSTKRGEHIYIEACAETQRLFPPGTLVVTMTYSGAFYYYTDLPVLRSDQVDATQFARLAAVALQAGRQICFVDFKWEEEGILHGRCPGTWERVATLDNASIWRLTSPTPPAPSQ